jgi:hypothetical protein
MKTLMILAAVSIFSFSTAAAQACDGMKDHNRGADSQAKNDSGKAGGKAAGKTKDEAKPGQPDNGASKS